MFKKNKCFGAAETRYFIQYKDMRKIRFFTFYFHLEETVFHFQDSPVESAAIVQHLQLFWLH